MNKRLVALCVAVCLPLLGGCFDVEQAMSLEKDLSGKAAFSMTVNMEPMVVLMARMQREMGGEPGEPTPAEIAKAKQDFLASKSQKKEDPKAQEEEVKKSLPPGVRLLESSLKDEGLKISARFVFGFDHISKLAEIHFPSQAGEEGAPGAKNPIEEPFSELKVQDEGSTLLLTTRALNPVAEQRTNADQMELSPAMKKQVEDAFKDLRVVFRIDAPLEVVEHNATRKEGETLVWEYDLKTMEKMTPQQLSQGVKVRFKK